MSSQLRSHRVPTSTFNGFRFVLITLIALAMLAPQPVSTALANDAKPLVTIPYPGDDMKAIPFQTRGDGDEDKLSPELRKLHEQVTGDRRNPSEFAYSDEQLQLLFSIDGDDPAPLVQVAITLAEGADVSVLTEARMAVLNEFGELVVGVIPVAGLLQLARIDEVVRVAPMKTTRNPAPPSRPRMSLADKLLGTRGEAEFDRQGLTGNGVIVGIIDSVSVKDRTIFEGGKI